MKRRKREKGIDCVAMKRQAQAEIYEEIKGLSPEQEIAYFRRRVAAGPFGKLWKTLEGRSRPKEEMETPARSTARRPMFSK